MKRSFRSAGFAVAMTLTLAMVAVLSLGCGMIDANGLFALETCDILNCEGLLFRNLDADHDDHDDMAGMDGMDDADAHDDEGDDHMDDMDDMDDMGGGEEHDH